MAVRRVDNDRIHTGIDQRLGTVNGVVCDADGRSDTQTSPLVLARVGEGAELDDVAVGDEADELAVAVHHREFFDAVGAQELFGFFKIRSILRNDEVAVCHDVCNGSVVIFFKTEVAVGDDSDQGIGLVHHRNASDAVFLHDSQSVPYRGFAREGHRVLDHAAFRSLYAAHFGGLLGNGHVLVDDADSTLAGHGDGHGTARHRIHGRGDDRSLQGDVPREIARELYVAREYFGVGRNEEDIVVGQAFADDFWFL